MARKEVIQLRCSEIEKTRWMDTAASQQLDLSSWIRLVLTKASSTPPPITQQTIHLPTLDAQATAKVGEHTTGTINKPQQ